MLWFYVHGKQLRSCREGQFSGQAYKKIGYNVDVLQHTACLIVNPIKVNSFAYLFNCTTVGRASD